MTEVKVAQGLKSMSREELVDALSAMQTDPRLQAEGDTAKLVHELQVHQIELEMQNRELRESQVSLDESRSRYVDLYDFAPVAYCSFDNDGRIIEANLVACSMFRMSRSALYAIPFHRLVAPEDRRQLHAHLLRCRTERTRVTSELTLRLDGAPPVIVQLVTTPVHTPEGGTRGFRSALVDVTSIKRSEQRLRYLAHASELLSSSFEHERGLAEVVREAVPLLADVCFIDVSEEGRRLRRIEIAFADGRHPELVADAKQQVPPIDGTSPQARVIASGEPILLAEATSAGAPEVSFAPLPAGSRPSALLLVPMIARGRTLGVITMIMADSERSYAQDDLRFVQDLATRCAMAMDNAQLYHQAQQAVRAREELLSLVSHELNNPLNSVMLSASGLAPIVRGLDNPRAVRQLDAIQRGAERMERLVSDLLDVSSIEAGKLSIEVREQGVGELLAEVVATLAPLAADKGVSLVLEPSSAFDEQVRCDRERVLQIFANIVGNAIKFTGKGGRVVIGARRAEREVRFSVSDSGQGINAEFLPHVFDRYAQASETAKLGRGLGLYIAKGLVEAHGSSIAVSSEVGVGTTFSFGLALVRPAATDERDRREPTHVLVVDDELDAREALRDLLQDHGYRVTERANGREALEYLRSSDEPPRVILLDLRMPIMGGREMFEELKKDAKLAQIPVVIFSADANLKQEAESMGAKVWLSKPVRVSQLLATLGGGREASAGRSL